MEYAIGALAMLAVVVLALWIAGRWIDKNTGGF